jgi:cytoplasmic iron level regulating protein YaaA (DUF328/UPF0246 family)
MAIKSDVLKEILVQPGFITSEKFASIENISKKQKKNILDVIVEQRIMKDENLHKLVAERQGYKFADWKVPQT